MGKNKTLKVLRRIARQMPTIERQFIECERVKGSELIKHGVEMVAGQNVDESGSYNRRNVVTREGINVNHARKLKKYYKQFGEPGIHGYINAVKEHARKEAEAKIQ
jgi:hypothetical protein